MDRLHQLERLRQSLAGVPPLDPSGLTREEVQRLVIELEDVRRRLQRFKNALSGLLADEKRLEELGL